MGDEPQEPQQPPADAPHSSSSPTPVSARTILRAVSEVRRRGQWPLLQRLESAEPELANYVLEEISSIHHTLLETGAPPKVVRRLQRQVQSLVLVSILSLRQELDGDCSQENP